MTVISETGSLVDPYQNFIALSRYARWIESENRRETWSETVDRYVNYMQTKFELSKKDWDDIRDGIRNLEVMPSMRALMTAGPALDRDNIAGYNCSFIAVDSPRAFDEAMYILMCGTGVGFSVESKYVNQLPEIDAHFERTDTVIVVKDSKSGWARAYKELLALLWQGQIPKIDITNVRPAGARLKTFGGRASGPQPLVDLFDFTIDTFLNAAGRKLTTVEAHDLMCKIGQVVVVGGVRRSALISLSDLHDYKMAKAKAGAWWNEAGQRSLANNSAVYTSQPSIGEFLQEWGHLYESKSGERGIFNLAGSIEHANEIGRDGAKIQGTNPCGEILLRSMQFCNLTEVVVRAEDTADDLVRKVRIATIIGTMQSALTDFKYLRKSWQRNCEEERLLGVSLTGQMGHTVLNGTEGIEKLATTLAEMREVARGTNEKYAKKLGINASAAITTVKPSGTVSQLTNVSSGMHPWHDDYYIRTVRGDKKDPLSEFLIDIGIPAETDLTNENGWVFSFPRKAPEGALTRQDMSAIDQLETWKVYKEEWTDHNPSITVYVKEDEWLSVAEWVYQNWDEIGGISFLPYDGGSYKQAPYQTIDETRYKSEVLSMPKNIDWTKLSLYETEDNTKGSQELACVAGSCELVDFSAESK